MSVLKTKDGGGNWTSVPSIKGDTGDAAGFGTVVASVDASHGTPSVTVTTSGDDTAKNFDFAFHNLQPAPYDDSELQQDFATLQGQFDTAVSAVTTDTEVTDIRVGADGITDTTAGASVRRQFTDLKSDLNDTKKIGQYNLLAGVFFEIGSMKTTDGTPQSSTTRIRSAYIDVSDVKNLHFKATSGYKYAVYFYTAIDVWAGSTYGTFFKDLQNWRTDERDVPLVPDIKYIRVLIADTSDSTSISIADVSKITITADYSLLRQQIESQHTTDFLYKWLNAENSNLALDSWANGVANVGTDANGKKINTDTTRLWSGVIEIPSLAGRIELSASTGYKVAYYLYDSSWNKITEKYWSTSYGVDIINTYKYLVVCVSNSGNTSITPSEGVNASVAFVPYNSLTGYVQSVNNINGEIDLGWKIASLTSGTGAETTSTTRLRSDFIYAGKNTQLFLNNSTLYNHLIYTYDLTKAYVSDIAWTKKPILVNQDCYIRILMCKEGNGTITSDEIPTITANEVVYRAFPQTMVGADNDNDVPSYFGSNLSTAIITARGNVFDATLNGDSFVFLTDVHWQSNTKHSPALVKEVIDNVNIGKIICGGDYIGGGGKSNMMSLMSDCINSFKNITRFYGLFGNHDSNKIGAGSSSDYFSKGETYTLIQKESDFIMDYGEPCYFFFDNPTTKTRYICLDTGEEGTTLDSAQSNWLSNALASMPTGYHALVFAHIIYQTTTTWHIGLQPSELARTSFMNDVCNILDTFNANHSDKKVEAIFGGHVHIDCNFTTIGGIPIVLTDCDARQTFTETSAGSGVANHAVGTINEQCFDVTTVDYANKTIKCVRVGRGSNRTITY